jgi:aryl-alcohol dehydrogenase-like predicted oxidoreductase
MDKRRIGKSDLHASIIGFGCWAMGNRGWGDDVDDDQSIRAVHAAIDRGINFFDTAPVYGLGHSEEVLGKALQGKRDQVLIATKCGLVWEEKEGQPQVRKHNGKESILREVDASLKRLNTDVIDLYQVHWPDEETRIEETMDALNEILKAGKVRYVGVSNFTVPMMKESLEYTPIVSLQSLYNLFQRDVEKEDLPFLEEQGMSLIPYSPLAQGILTGKFNIETTFGENDVRRHHPLFKNEWEQTMDKVQRLQTIALSYRRPLGQLATNWLLTNPVVSSIICGAKTEAQVIENAAAVEWKLQEADVQAMRAIAEE